MIPNDDAHKPLLMRDKDMVLWMKNQIIDVFEAYQSYITDRGGSVHPSRRAFRHRLFDALQSIEHPIHMLDVFACQVEHIPEKFWSFAWIIPWPRGSSVLKGMLQTCLDELYDSIALQWVYFDHYCHLQSIKQMRSTNDMLYAKGDVLAKRQDQEIKHIIDCCSGESIVSTSINHRRTKVLLPIDSHIMPSVDLPNLSIQDQDDYTRKKYILALESILVMYSDEYQDLPLEQRLVIRRIRWLMCSQHGLSVLRFYFQQAIDSLKESTIKGWLFIQPWRWLPIHRLVRLLQSALKRASKRCQIQRWVFKNKLCRIQMLELSEQASMLKFHIKQEIKDHKLIKNDIMKKAQTMLQDQHSWEERDQYRGIESSDIDQMGQLNHR